MMLRFSLCILILFFASKTDAKDIYTLIKNGEIEEARDSLSRYSTAARREGRVLFFQALIEQDAYEAERLLLASLDLTLPVRYREEAIYRLTQYYYLSKQQKKLEKQLLDYLTRWETGLYQSEMYRYQAESQFRSGDVSDAQKTLKRLIRLYSDKESAEWAGIDDTRYLASKKQYSEMRKALKKLSKSKNSEIASVALYLVCADAIKRKKIDDAVFYYNLLREAYPNAVGLDKLVDDLGGISLSNEDSNAENLTGTFYSVQVGVFSSKGNAKRQADKFKNYDKKIDIKNKTVSGKRYHVVYIGRFKTFDQAQVFKEQIEAVHGEAYQVLAR